MASSEQQSIALTQDYSYSLLPAGEYIRVLELLPGAVSDPIHCHLNIVSLASVWRTYHAISYVWGDPSSQRDIFVDNKAAQNHVQPLGCPATFPRRERKTAILGRRDMYSAIISARERCSGPAHGEDLQGSEHGQSLAGSGYAWHC